VLEFTPNISFHSSVFFFNLWVHRGYSTGLWVSLQHGRTACLFLAVTVCWERELPPGPMAETSRRITSAGILRGCPAFSVFSS